jgi:hypothetical protein
VGLGAEGGGNEPARRMRTKGNGRRGVGGGGPGRAGEPSAWLLQLGACAGGARNSTSKSPTGHTLAALLSMDKHKQQFSSQAG